MCLFIFLFRYWHEIIITFSIQNIHYVGGADIVLRLQVDARKLGLAKMHPRGPK